MDFNDTPEEAAFREKAQTWLNANAELKDPNDSASGMLSERTDKATISSSKAWQKKKEPGRNPSVFLAQGARRPGRNVNPERHLEAGRSPIQDSARYLRYRPGHVRPHHHDPRHR